MRNASRMRARRDSASISGTRLSVADFYRRMSVLPIALALPLLQGTADAENTATRSSTFVPVEVCQTSTSSVVVKTALGRACIRYSASTEVQGAEVVIMSLHGDRDPQIEVKKDFRAIERERTMLVAVA